MSLKLDRRLEGRSGPTVWDKIENHTASTGLRPLKKKKENARPKHIQVRSVPLRLRPRRENDTACNSASIREHASFTPKNGAAEHALQGCCHTPTAPMLELVRMKGQKVCSRTATSLQPCPAIDWAFAPKRPLRLLRNKRRNNPCRLRLHGHARVDTIDKEMLFQLIPPSDIKALSQ